MRNDAWCSTFHGGEVINGTTCLDQQKDWTMKLNHRWLPIGSHRKNIDNLAPVKFPCCNEPGEETHDHILACQAASRNDVRTQFLELYGVPNLMRFVILTSIDEWNKDQNYTCPITQDIQRDRTLHEAVHAQNEIGWKQFLRGCAGE